MRICLVSETFTPELNGVALTVASLLEQLLRQGHRVSVIRPRQVCDTDAVTPRLYPQMLVRGMALPFYPGLQLGLARQKRLREFLQKNSPDAIYIATEGPLGRQVQRVAKQMNICVVSGIHTRFDIFMRHYGLPWLSGLALNWMRRFHNRSQASLVATDELAMELRQKKFTNVEIMQRAVDTQMFNPIWRSDSVRSAFGVADGDVLAICVGRIASEKNIDLLIQSFMLARESQPNLRLLMVGDGPHLDTLRAATSGIIWAGALRGRALACAYASADFFALPSLSETFGNVTLEALACGLPVVAFDYAAAKQHIVHGRNGYLANSKNALEFTHFFAQLASDDGARKQMGEQARNAVAHLNPGDVARELVALLDTLIHKENNDEHRATSMGRLVRS
jgi:glycosyltransferase involved in cell wall biosynthesis